MTDNIISKGEIKMKNYSNQVSKMNQNTLVALVLSKDYQSNGWYKRSADKQAFVAALLERFKGLVTTGEVTPQMVERFKGAENLKSLRKMILKENSGLRKAPKTEAQLQALRDLQVLEKALEMGKFAGELLLALQNPETLQFFHQEELKAIAYGLVGYTGKLKKDFGPLFEFAGTVDQKELLAQSWRIQESTLRVLANLLGLASTGSSLPCTGVKAPQGMFVSHTSKGLKVSISDVLAGFGIKGSTNIHLSKESFKRENLEAISRVLLVGLNGTVYRYNTSSHLSRSGKGDLRDFCVNSHIPLFQILSLMLRKGVDMNSLLSSEDNWILLEEYETKTKYQKSRKSIRISKNPLANPVIRAANAQCHFWGISSPDTLHKGLFKSLVSSTGFCEVQPDGTIKTVVGDGDTKTLNDGSVVANTDAAKPVARFIKLGREGYTFDIGKTFVVTGIPTLDQRVIDALSTGTLHTSTQNLATVGQCRVVSGADKGGMKATFGSMALIDSALDAQGISLVSMNSLKTNTYGLKKVLGLEEDGEFTFAKQYFSNFGCELYGIWVDNFEVEITNFYTIQAYRPTNRNEILNSWDRVVELKEQEIANIGSNISEDKVFLDYVLSEMQETFEGNLVETLKSLEAQGIIERKGNTTTVTSSEFDRMAMSHGEDKAIEWMDNLLNDRLNQGSEKRAELDLARQVYTGDFKKGPGISALVEYEEFFNLYNAICTRHGIDPNEGAGSFVSRDFLVDLCLELFKAEETGLEWLGVRMVSGKESSYIRLPLGVALFGDFHETSTIYEEKVVVTGFLGVFLKDVTYVMNFFLRGNLTINIFKSFADSLNNRLYADCIGKGVGRLNAKGMYGVLSPAWWSKSPRTVTLLGANYYSDLNRAIIAKHPLLFDNSLAQVNVESMFPQGLVKGLTVETLEILGFVFSTTLFCHAEWLLALQNDCDGDLGRITFHEGLDIPFFEAKTLKKGAVGEGFFKNYVESEENFLKLKDIVWSTRTVDHIAEACTDAARAKADVAKFTSNLQLFSQRFTADTGIGKESKIYHTMDRMLGIWVQEFSMMAIKHNQISRGKGAESEMFGQQRIIDMKLPDFYQITTLRHLEMTGEETNPGEETLVAWLDENGFNKEQHGMKNNTEFAREVHKILCNIGPRSVGADILGKDYTPEEVAKFGLGKGSVSGLNPKIMQDLLLAKLLGFDIQAMEEEYAEDLAERIEAEKALEKAKKEAEKANAAEKPKKVVATKAGTKTLMPSVVVDNSIELPL